MKKIASLTPIASKVTREGATEPPFVGEYTDFEQPGSYLCRQCGQALFRSKSKFHSGCGWPSFDEEIAGAVLRKPDEDGERIEIICAHCNAHLGHVFKGEGFTPKNVRHCVNSVSLDFVPDQAVGETEEALFAAGCFWGVEYYFKKLPGVLKTEVGYTGGTKSHPTYEEICAGNTGHFEAIRVVYDPKKISYEALVKFFFEIHDPSDAGGQGPDRGQQYQSVIFYYDDKQRRMAEKLIETLKNLGYPVVTQLLPVSVFWRAEGYHQDYYAKTHKQPYCHRYEKKFP